MRKTNLSRHDSRRASIDHPVGDAYGGVAFGERNDPATAIAVSAGIQGGGAILGADAQKDAAKSASASEAARLAELTRQYNLTQQRLKPFLTTGRKALRRYEAGIKRAPDYADVVAGVEQDPGYQFALEQGAETIQGAAATQGLLRSGRTLTGLTQYAQDLARSKAGEAWAREYGVYHDRQNALASLVAGGQNAATGAGTNPALRDNTMAQLALQQGNIRADMYTGIGNAANSAVSNATLAAMLKTDNTGGYGWSGWGN